MGWLDGSVALVTGGASGLGRAVVERFVQEGARCAVLDRSGERLTCLQEQLGDAVLGVPGDVTVWEDNVKAVEAAVRAFDRLDIFVGNAGIYDDRVSLRELPGEKIDAAFTELFEVDVKGYLMGAKASLSELEKTQGCIIFTASISGLFAGYGGVLYVPAKHAVVGLTRQLALELAPAVRVNAVAPGGIATNLQGLTTLPQELDPAAGPAERQRGLREPADYAGTYLLLASREHGGVMTGTVVLADGGSSLRGRGGS